ncbi:hypothetical protein EIN_314580 [Entamoeba invadens IP1]|uniref:Uncharacterized protein n=1 Tax=Entamoeba invadens IP1 TaxID=370355 RepID=A0A0A1TZC0_ENTIV|nr:hypothetical protein EIN_314580 [Entamoeba invadens IP1]ELP86909.1 hypothetical protein EIN_314580 [Entamoeba invadens IP1]|eukprot:XP_004253680.1 hypothetical protein EIN_314580 [Entamoeba invadens IP1]
MEPLVLFVLFGLSLSYTCQSPYTFSPLSTVESSVTIYKDSFEPDTIDCNGETNSTGAWLAIENVYETQLTFHITATEAIEMQFYKTCGTECEKDSNDVYLVLSPGHVHMIHLIFNTPYNTILFYPTFEGTTDAPILVENIFPQTISTTLFPTEGIFDSVVKLSMEKQGIMTINISSVMDIETTVKHPNMSTTIFKASVVEFESEKDNMQFLVTFKSMNVTVVDVEFQYKNSVINKGEQVIDIFPYVRYETIPFYSMNDGKGFCGYKYKANAPENTKVELDLCNNMYPGLQILFEDDVEITQFDCGNTNGVKYVVNSNKFKFSIGFVNTGYSVTDRSFYIYAYSIPVDEENGLSTTAIACISVASVIVVLLLVVAIVLIIVFVRKSSKKSKYSSLDAKVPS